MSIEFDSAVDIVTRTTNLPSITSFTIMEWVYILTDRNDVGPLMEFGNSGDTDNYYFGLNTDGLQLVCFTAATATGTTLSLNTWYHLAMTCAGTGAGQTLCYLNGVQDISNSGQPAAAAQKIWINCDFTGTIFANARIGAIKIYSAVLTAQEIQQEMQQFLPVRTANLNCFCPMFTSTDTGDYSGSGNDFTLAGTLVSAPNPPIPWSMPVTQSIITMPTSSIVTGRTTTRGLTRGLARRVA